MHESKLSSSLSDSYQLLYQSITRGLCGLHKSGSSSCKTDWKEWKHSLGRGRGKLNWKGNLKDGGVNHSYGYTTITAFNKCNRQWYCICCSQCVKLSTPPELHHLVIHMLWNWVYKTSIKYQNIPIMLKIVPALLTNPNSFPPILNLDHME